MEEAIRELLGVGTTLFCDVGTRHVGAHFVKIPLTINWTFAPFWDTSKGCLNKQLKSVSIDPPHQDFQLKKYLKKESFNCHITLSLQLGDSLSFQNCLLRKSYWNDFSIHFIQRRSFFTHVGIFCLVLTMLISIPCMTSLTYSCVSIWLY